MKKLILISIIALVATSCTKELSREKVCGKVVFSTEFTVTVAFTDHNETIARGTLHVGDTYCK